MTAVALQANLQSAGKQKMSLIGEPNMIKKVFIIINSITEPFAHGNSLYFVFTLR